MTKQEFELIWRDYQLNLGTHLEECERDGVHIFKYSTTERQDFKYCRRLWDFASPSRKGLAKKQVHEALWMGTGFHHVLEEYYRNNVSDLPEEFVATTWNEWLDEEVKRLEDQILPRDVEAFQESVDNMRTLGEGMLVNYVTWAQKADLDEETGFKNILSVEREFQVPVRDAEGNIARWTDRNGEVWEVHLVGRMDMLVLDFSDRVWVVDHKTSKDRVNVEHLILDDQMTIYIWAIQQILGVEVEGALYNCVRKKLPTIPKELKAGGLSQAKDIDTTYDVYLKAIEEHEFDPADYQKILNILADKPNGFQMREKVRRNQHEIALAGHLLLCEGIDMLNAPFIYPNPNWDCSWRCDYKPLCEAVNRGDDVQFIIDKAYEKSDRGEVYKRESTIE